jgi:hypothetical protein
MLGGKVATMSTSEQEASFTRNYAMHVCLVLNTFMFI